MLTIIFVIFITLIVLCGLFVSVYGGIFLFAKVAFFLEELQSKRIANKAASIRAKYIYPDHNGVLPFAEDAIASQQWINHQLELLHKKIETQLPVQNVPQTLHYAPKFASVREEKQIAQQQYEVLQPVKPVADFYSLWNSKQLPQDKFLLGYRLDNNEQIFADWCQLYSSLIGGESGSGKSTLLRLILAQSALQGGKFIVIDPHFNAGEESLGSSLMPIRQYMMCDVAVEEKDILQSLGYMNRLIDSRLNGNKDKTPIILIVDETTVLLRSNVSGQLEYTLRNIAQQTRKASVFAVCTGQQWSGKAISVDVRNSFVSIFSCPSRRQTARTLADDPTFSEIAANLKVGQAVWKSTKTGIVTFAIPNTTQEHIALLADNLNGSLQNKLPAYTVIDQPKNGKNALQEKVVYPDETIVYSNGDSSLPNYYTNGNKLQNGNGSLPNKLETDENKLPGEVLYEEAAPIVSDNKLPNKLDTDVVYSDSDQFSAKELRVMEMLESGKYKTTEIIKEVWGVTTGKPYADAMSEYQEIQRKILRLYKKHASK